MNRRLARVLVVAALAVPVLSACSASVDISGQTVSKEELARQVTTALANTMSVDAAQVPRVTCPQGLEARVGASTTCVLDDQDAGKRYDVAVKVMSIDGGKASFQLEVAPTSAPTSSAQ